MRKPPAPISSLLALAVLAQACGSVAADAELAGRNAAEPAKLAARADLGGTTDTSFPYRSFADLSRDAFAIVVGRVISGDARIVTFAVETAVAGAVSGEIRVLQPGGPIPSADDLPGAKPVPMPMPLPPSDGRQPMPMPLPGVPERTTPSDRGEGVSGSVPPDLPVATKPAVPTGSIDVAPLRPADGSSGSGGANSSSGLIVKPALVEGGRYLLFLNRVESAMENTFTLLSGYQGTLPADDPLKVADALAEIRRVR